MDANADLAKLALDYHAYPTPGEISVTPTKTLANQDDLSLTSSTGVAVESIAIHAAGPDAPAKYTSHSNLVGVTTNAHAMLGLGKNGQIAPHTAREGQGQL